MEIKEIKVRDQLKITQNNKVLEKAYDDISVFKAQVITENSEFISKQGENLNRFVNQIKSIMQRLKQNICQCEQSIKKMQEQTNELDSKVQKFRKQIKINNKEIQYKNQIKKLKEEYINLCKSRIITAQKIQMNKLSKLDLEDRKSKANDVFKWIIVTMYDQAQSKYYWPNFLNQAIKNDQGKDLRQRLGKINASKAKQQQKLKTQSFLKSIQEIKQSQQLKNVIPDIQRIKVLAQYFRGSYEITHKIKEYQTKIVKNKEKSLEKDQQFMRQKARSQALKDRIKIKRQYHKILTYIQQQLQPKQQLYRQKSKQTKKVAQQLSKLLSWQPTINIAKQAKNQCQCMIF